LRYFALLMMIGLVVTLVIWFPFEDKDLSEQAPVSPGAEGFGLVINKCKTEARAMAREQDVNWEDGTADSYCNCTALELLSRNEREEDILEQAKALTTNDEIFRSFMLLESIVETCTPSDAG
jgi:hypothetical protein